jgi:hypothetical protein
MSQKDFFSIWTREAEAALAAKKAGLVIDIWKNVWALGVWWLSSMWIVWTHSTRFYSICRS